MGNTTTMRAKPTPGHWRAKASAKGTPKTRLTRVDIRAVRRLSHSAIWALSPLKSVGICPQGTRSPTPISGVTIAKAAIMPKTRTLSGREDKELSLGLRMVVFTGS